MTIEDVIKNRRSIRKYASKKVHKKDVLEMLDIALWAPSACNRQAHKVIFIEDKKILRELVYLGSAPFLKNAPAVLLFLYDDIGDNIAYYDDIQSSSALIENFLLVASSRGFGACWVCHLPPKRTLRKLFNIPAGVNPIAAVSIGYIEKQPSVVPRKFFAKDIFFEGELPLGIYIPEKNLKLLIKRILRIIFYLFPPSIRYRVSSYVDKKFVKKFKN